MSTWTQDELDKINADLDFTVAAADADGNMPKKVRIWSVPVGQRLFIRSFNGTAGKWYGLALANGRGRVSAGGVTRDVRFVPVTDAATNESVDASYYDKYAGSPYAETMATEPVRQNTLEVIPAD